MMFLRIFILLSIFNKELAIMSWTYFLFLFAVSISVGYLMYRAGEKGNKESSPEIKMEDNNPLEFKVALLFAVLYIVFSALTALVIATFGSKGLTNLSVIVGFTDIDPFLLNLFQGHYNLAATAIIIASMQAIASNNVLKCIYAFIIGERKTAVWALKGFGAILFFNILVILWLNFG
jgi:uncharacterized membrane protein (DUF4010 family)